jgi:hypothetical protein
LLPLSRLIFGQTTIYPTIGALIDLISEPGNIPVSQRLPPAQKRVRQDTKFTTHPQRSLKIELFPRSS